MADHQKLAPKQYGLIIPKKNLSLQRNTVSTSRPALFDDDSDNFEGSTVSPLAARKQRQDSKMKMETEALIHKTLTEDPNAFEYDKVFDQVQEQKAAQEGRARGREEDKDRKPKYVHALMKASKEREKEYERRTERKVQREREAEGTQFADKEAFVTSSYKKKMQEQQEAEARERELEKVEARLDVTKQDGLGIFYKHLLKQQTGEEKVKNADEAWSSSVKEDVNERVGEDSGHGDASEHPNIKKRRRESPTSSNDLCQDSTSTCTEEVKMPRRARSTSIPAESQVPAGLPDVLMDEADLTVSPIKKLSAAETKAAQLEKRVKIMAKRSTEDSALDARERYLARQAAKRMGSSTDTPV